MLPSVLCSSAGQWQYRIAEELGLDPKSVFHHLKPLYRDELICHMQLAIPPGHKTLERGSSLASSSQLLGQDEGLSSSARGGSRSNLTMSALLWSNSFFSPLRLPAPVRSLMALHHLLPLQHQATELLRSAPNNILLEEEVRHFCTAKLLNSDQASRHPATIWLSSGRAAGDPIAGLVGNGSCDGYMGKRTARVSAADCDPSGSLLAF